MTPEEAEKKYCPKTFARDMGQPGLCLANLCMAWRWSRAKETQAYLDAVQARMKETGENFNIATNKVYADVGSTFEQVEGYCGAFGKDGAP